MRKWEFCQTVLWSVCLAGLPFSALLNRRLDLWHGQAWWMHWWTFVFFGLWLASGRAPKRNPALACWVTALFASTLWMWTRIMLIQGVYPTTLLMGLGHVLILVMVYLSATACWTPSMVSKLLQWLAWSAVVCLVYSLFQLMHLDPFFKNLDHTNRTATMHGMTGNPTHYGAYLSMALPLFFSRKGWGWIVAWFGAFTLILVTHSATALMAGLVVSLYGLWSYYRKLFLSGLACAIVLIALALLQANELNPYGRFQTWQLLWPYVTQHPWVGSGVGFLSMLSREFHDKSQPLFGWRHAHNEYYQILLEQGIVGLAACAVAIGHLVARARLVPSTLRIPLSGILLAFALNSLLSFPAHLWVLGFMPLFAYCALYACAEPDKCL